MPSRCRGVEDWYCQLASRLESWGSFPRSIGWDLRTSSKHHRRWVRSNGHRFRIGIFSCIRCTLCTLPRWSWALFSIHFQWKACWLRWSSYQESKRWQLWLRPLSIVAQVESDSFLCRARLFARFRSMLTGERANLVPWRWLLYQGFPCTKSLWHRGSS